MPIRLRTQNCGTWRNLCHAIPTRLADTPEGVLGDVLLVSDSLTFSTSLAWGSLTGQHLRNHEPSQQMLAGELCSMTKLGNFRRPFRAETTGTRGLAGKLLQSKGIDNLAPQRVSSPDGVCAKLRQESRKNNRRPTPRRAFWVSSCRFIDAPLPQRFSGRTFAWREARTPNLWYLQLVIPAELISAKSYCCLGFQQ